MRSIFDHDRNGRVMQSHNSYCAIHFGFRNITNPDTEQGSHHPLPAAKVLCLTALTSPTPFPRGFGYALYQASRRKNVAGFEAVTARPHGMMF